MPVIPKIIHYCWFGNNPKPDIVLKCIESWKIYFPDYEIKEWNESNSDFNDSPYAKEAYENKKWAFVSDYVRFVVLNKYGGLYFDTDVEFIKPIPPKMLEEQIVALENKDSIATGLIMACFPGDSFCKWMIDSYRNDHFMGENKIMNLTTVCERTMPYFIERGFKRENIESIVGGYHIYPSDFFCPMDMSTREITLTNNTLSIHHYSATWYGERERYIEHLRIKFSKFLPKRIAKLTAVVIATIKYEGFGSFFKRFFGHFKKRKKTC